jgi:cytochrome c oxidase subunit 2
MKMNRIRTIFTTTLALAASFLLYAPAVIAQDISSETTAAEEDMVKGIATERQLAFQEPATPVMEQLIGLHDYLLIVISLISLFVLGLLVYVCVRFRADKNPNPSKVTHNTLLEIVWIAIPVLILVSIAVPSLRVHYFMDKTAEPDMTLKVTGYQWYWGYEYPDFDDLSFLSYMKKKEELKPGEPRLLATDKAVVVPTNANVRVLVTGADVIHSWAMPAFGVKMDAVPGRLNETWFNVEEPGIYYGQCSELCGKDHGFMPIEVRAVEPEVFEAWVKRAQEGEYALDGLRIPSEAQDKLAQAEAEVTNVE